ncbi:MAG: histidine--tRNA ligase [Bacteroidales bacterium]|nr:histidine--tRNA ligase [Bacteroidales bacterium]MCL2133270.1 histidine--tRNA ligase [Bacteroidales bacterium]
MAQRTAIPSGTRDFLPREMLRRNYIFDTIRTVFKQYGYVPIETPAMENLSTLLGKYGEEGDKLLYRILNSGNAFAGVDPSDLANNTLLSAKVCEKGLRYDLTVPFARFVVQHQQDIVFPFKRYQIQPVWRADRPQKGRYREFYQCDVDVIGSHSLLYEVELVQIVDAVFTQLNIPVTVKINNRKILSGIAEIMGAADRLTDITVAIDKIDKIGQEAVLNELLNKGITETAVQQLLPILTLSGANEEQLTRLSAILSASTTALQGIEELRTIFNYLEILKLGQKVELDLSLARGLNYYTGAIFEVKSNEISIGSICGGGRYDDLTGVFGLKNVSGVGISFGADRIYDVINALDRFPEAAMEHTKVLFLNLGQKESIKALECLKELRAIGISAEIYPEIAKMKKQMEYADKKAIPYVVIIGEEELNDNTLSFKDMRSGEQKKSDLKTLLADFSC